MRFKSEDINKYLSLIKEKNIHWYGLACIVSLYIYVGYESVLMNWYDAHVMPLLAIFSPNIWSIIATIVLYFIAGCNIFSKWRHRYQFDNKVAFCLIWLIFLLIKYRVSGKYVYASLIWGISYVDAIMLIAANYFVLAVANKIRLYVFLNKNDDSEENEKTILRDWPIEDKSEDIFDLQGEAEKISKEIHNLDRKKTWSLAVIAPWGTGKTSFLNLIVKEIGTKQFDVLYFNPRDSKSYKSIQEDFFTQVSCILAKYDNRCNNVMKDYMASLKLIDNRGIIEKLVNFYKIWNKDDLKESLKTTFSSLEKKVIVLIDDFDRLSKDEIFEVLKLIDSNAAFANLVFLTAYDKNQVNKSLGESNNTDDACFVDKFFNLEFVIPSRPYSYITNYIGDNLCHMLDAKAYEASSIKKTLSNAESILKDYLPTLRDAKRFINQFYMDYSLVRGDVKLYEYVLVQLIKYRYHDEYTKLFRKQYVEYGGFFSSRHLYYLKKEIDDKCKIKTLLVKLFPKQDERGGYSGETYKHIFDSQSFDNYFVNQIYGTMRLGEMESIFHGTTKEAYSKIDEWIKNEKQLNDIVAYLYSFDMDKFSSGDYYIRFADVVTYLAVKRPESNAYWLFMRLIYIPNIEGYDGKYNINQDTYKQRLLQIILNVENDCNLQLVRHIHYSFQTLEIKDEEQLIKDADIWPSIKKQFLKVCPDFEDLQVMKRWLYNCIDHMELSSRNIILDTDCLEAFKQRVLVRPALYIKDFVFLGGISSNPEFNTIACEPFWEQIFGDANEFEKFISDCEIEAVENISLVRNFWELYKANKYKQIEFDNQGNVQDKIKRGLMCEASMLKQIQDVWYKINNLPKITAETPHEEVEDQKRILQNAIEDVDNIKLNLTFKFDVKKEILSKLESLKSISSDVA